MHLISSEKDVLKYLKHVSYGDFVEHKLCKNLVIYFGWKEQKKNLLENVKCSAEWWEIWHGLGFQWKIRDIDKFFIRVCALSIDK